MTKKKPVKAVTPEAMLQAIIKRQDCNGRFGNGSYLLCYPDSDTTLLGVLMNPAGLKSAYGDYPCNTAIGHFEDGGDFRIQKVIPQWTTNAHKILDTWLETSSPEATIKTAFDLLPLLPTV